MVAVLGSEELGEPVQVLSRLDEATDGEDRSASWLRVGWSANRPRPPLESVTFIGPHAKKITIPRVGGVKNFFRTWF